eukprot:scaffold13345_cov209-Alexandrium_tamarense.AAC.11
MVVRLIIEYEKKAHGERGSQGLSQSCSFPPRRRLPGTLELRTHGQQRLSAFVRIPNFSPCYESAVDANEASEPSIVIAI